MAPGYMPAGICTCIATPAGLVTCIIWPACAPGGTCTIKVPGWTTGPVATGCICIACPAGNQSRSSLASACRLAGTSRG